MGYRDDLRILRAYIRKIEGRQLDKPQENSLQARRERNTSENKRKRSVLNCVLRWQKRNRFKYRKKMRLYMREYHKRKKAAKLDGVGVCGLSY